MSLKVSQQKIIRHRPVFALPTRLSFWSLVLMTTVFFFLFLSYFLYTQTLVRELERDEDALSRAAAQFMVNVFNPQSSLEDPDRLLIFIQTGTDTEVLRELFSEVDHPIVITDSLGHPQLWWSIGIPTDYDTKNPEVLERVNKIIRWIDRQNAPYRIYNESLDERFVIHYGDPPSLVKLRTIPLYLGAVLIVFLVITVWILRRQASTERSLIWAGMARESAHQLGTPLSSLFGWLELLKIDLTKAKVPGKAKELKGQEGAIVEGIAQDIERLSKVANRFELIGRKTGHQKIEVGDVLRDTERYFRARLPKRGTKINLQVDIEEIPPIRGNATLLEWAFENIIKNSIDALTGRGGVISIRACYDSDRDEVDIIFKDNGPGIAREVRRHIFDTGVTTKSKGWGVGLALVRRIIEENHGGRIVLTHSSPEKGTVFLVCLPSAWNDKESDSGKDFLVIKWLKSFSETLIRRKKRQ
ncbi:MAG TPA: HAMP domain-containing sensor histidine kinase [archaeon]|nr:HAMP domain-containing sensor histidine kinase [archaeon]